MTDSRNDADHDADGIEHVAEELARAKADGWDAIVPSALQPDAQWRRNGVYVPLEQALRRPPPTTKMSSESVAWPENRCPQCGTVHPLLASPQPSSKQAVAEKCVEICAELDEPMTHKDVYRALRAYAATLKDKP